MRILVVEDNPERIKKFKRALIGNNVDYTDNAFEGRTLVKRNQYDVIFLDHDLGGESYVPSDHYNTGYQVAKEIQQSQNKSAQIIIHSCNSTGASNIASLLPGSLRIPFTILDLDSISKMLKGNSN